MKIFTLVSLVMVVCFTTSGYSQDGTTDGSETVIGNSAAFLYPNLVTNRAVFKYSANHNIVSLELYDQSGTMVRSFINHKMRGRDSYTEELSFSGLPDGIYLLLFTDATDFKIIEVVKQDY